MRRTAEEAAATREALITAGVEYFAEHGYASTPLNDVADALGVTRGAIYHHFGSKEGFFAAVVERVMQDLRARIEAVSIEAGGGWPGIRAGCDAFLEAAVHPTFRRVALIEAPAVLGWSAWKEIDDRTTGQSLTEGLQELSDFGSLHTPDVEALAMALSGAMNELALWIAGQSDSAAALARATDSIQALLAAVATSR